MKQLSGLDASFLAAESDRVVTHINMLIVLDKPTPDYAPFPAWRRQLAERLHLLEPLRRRLVPVPMGLDHPYWIEDPDFDLDFHVRHTAVPPPGTDEQLDELVGRLIAGPMDREHPLWVSHVIEGLAPSDDGTERFAILLMIHHSAVDGAAGAELFALMLEDSPDAESPSGAGEWAGEPEPSVGALLGRAAAHGLTRPGRGLLLAARAGQHVARATGNRTVIDVADRVRAGLRGPVGDLLNLGRRRDPDQHPPRLAAAPPPTPFNAPISRYRRFGRRTLSLADVKATGRSAGATVNDVVVAMCAGGLRRWLSEHAALPDEPLTAMIPVSLRTGGETDPWTNRVSGTVAALPTDLADPLDRLAATHDALDASKAVFAAVPAALLPDLADLSAPALTGAAAAMSRLTTRWSTSTGFPFNLIISNVPGPQEPLYMAGARARHYYPVSAVADGMGLNITVQSYDGSLDLGLVACAALVPDLAALADDLVAEFALLQEQVGG